MSKNKIDIIDLINKIVWWIPIKKYRDAFRNYLVDKYTKPNIYTPDIPYGYSLDIDTHNEKVINLYKIRRIEHVLIETINRCNGKCSFCPVSVGNEKREYKKMSSELFNKIIDDLVEIKYKGNVGIFFTNEPFLDDRITEFAKIAKSKLPEAFIHVLTNGSVLSLEKYKEAYKYLDLILINNYSKDNKLKDTNKAIYEFCLKNPEYKEKTIIQMREEEQILSSRAGNAPNRQDNLKTVPYLCHVPAVQFAIRPDGKVSLCCCDTYGEMTMGDLTKNSINEIWNSDTYKKLNKLMIKGRNKIKICKYCDFIDYVPDKLEDYTIEEKLKSYKLNNQSILENK